jgi:hypothetical protein
MLLEIIFSYHWLIAKEFKNTFPKDLQNKLSGANMVQNFDYIKTLIYLELLSLQKQLMHI